MDEQSSRKSLKNKGKELGKTTKRMQQIRSDKKLQKKKAKFVEAPKFRSIFSSSDSDDADDVNLQVKNKAVNKKSSSKSSIASTHTLSTSTTSLKRHLEEDEIKGRKEKKSRLSPMIDSELCNSDERQKFWEILANAMGGTQSPESKSDELPEPLGYNPYMTADVPTHMPTPSSSLIFPTDCLNNVIPAVHIILMNKVPYTNEMKNVYCMLREQVEQRQLNKEEKILLFILHLLDQVSTLNKKLSQCKSYQRSLSQIVRSYKEFVGKQILCLKCEDVRVNTVIKEIVEGKQMFVSKYCKYCLEKINERNEKTGQHKIRFHPITFRGSNFNSQKGKKIENIRSVVSPSPAPHRSWKSELDSEDKDEDVVMMPSTSRSVASPKKKVVQKGKSSTPASSYISFSLPPSSDVEETAQDSKESSDSEVFDSDDDSSAAEESDAE